jgi:tRNA A-37 threonylcarbamoyl transferase component Bud32
MLETALSKRFEIVRRLGEGAMGTVYEAIDAETHQRIALKLLRSTTADAIFRFKREFRSLQDIHHPNLVTLGELVSEGAGWFFTMELVRGTDFVSWVQEPRAQSPSSPFAFDEGRLRAALAQLAQGLATLHEAHKVHRDVKPSNVLVEPDGRVVVLDFGLVTDAQDVGQSMSDLDVVGTPAYMAPEQAASRAVGPAADWYAVGVLLYESMTGRVPFSGAPLEILLRKQREEPPPPSTLVPGLPPDLDDLCVRLLSFDPAARPTDRRMLRAFDALPSGVAGTGSSVSISLGVPFVGREEPLAALAAALSHVGASGHAATVVVRGESGIGKSCMVRHFTDTNVAQDKQLLVLAGRCYEREAVPYKALDGVVDELARFLGRLPTADAAHFLPARTGPLVQVFPVLRRVEAITQLRGAVEAPVDVHELRARAFNAMRELLERIADRRRVIIAIDDLQWADEDSLALLKVLLRPPDEPNVLFIVTMRDESIDATIATKPRPPTELSIPGDVRTIQLGRLGKDDARALASRLVERVAPQMALHVETLASEADGHPLFLDEIVRHLFAVGAPQGALKLEDALWARIASLEETPRRIVELCAIAGAPLPQDAVSVAAGANPSDFARLLSFLRVAHLVRTAGTKGSDAIECFHGRIRDAVVKHLSAAERTERHERLAIALESTAHADPDLLAILWLGAGDFDKAGEHMLAAADRAAGALAFDRAARLYERALELRAGGTRRPTREEERALQAKIGDAFSNAGRGAKAARAYRGAAVGANAAEALDLQRRAADQLLRSGHFDEGLTAVLDVLASIGMRLPRTPLEALVSFVFWRVVLAVRGLKYKVVDASHVSPRELTRIDTSASIAISIAFIDPIIGALFQARSLLASLRAGEPRRVARTLASEVAYRGTIGGPGWPTTVALDAEARRVARDVGDPFAIAYSTGTSAVAHFLAGHFVDSLARCEEAERTFIEECGGMPWETLTVRLFAIYALAHMGRFAELRARHAAALTWALARGDLYAAVNLRIGYANLVWLVEGDPARARSEVTDAMRQWSTRGFHLEHYYELVALTNADLYEGKPRDAFDRLSARWRPMRRSFLLRVQTVRLYARNMRARTAIATAEVEVASRDELLAVADDEVGLVEREGMLWTAAMSTLVRAAIARFRGEQAQAMTLLERAIGEASQAKLGLVEAGARYALGVCKGGAEGKSLVAGALQAVAAEGVKDPARLIATVAPGFGATVRAD